MKLHKWVLLFSSIFAIAGSVTAGLAGWVLGTSISMSSRTNTVIFDTVVLTDYRSLSEAGLSFEEGNPMTFNKITSRDVTDETGSTSSTSSCWSDYSYDLLLKADYSDAALLHGVPWDDESQFALQIEIKSTGLGSPTVEGGSIYCKTNDDYYFSLYDSGVKTDASYTGAYLLPLRSRSFLSIYGLCQMTTLIKMDAKIEFFLRFGFSPIDVSYLEPNDTKSIVVKVSLVSKSTFESRLVL